MSMTFMAGGRRRRLFRRKHGGPWHVRFNVNGKDILRSLGTTNEEVAKERAKQIIEAKTNNMESIFFRSGATHNELLAELRSILIDANKVRDRLQGVMARLEMTKRVTGINVGPRRRGASLFTELAKARVDGSMKRQLKAIAEKRGESISVLFREALAQFFEREGRRERLSAD